MNWKLTLPIETPHPGNPDEYLQPELASFSIDPYFLLSDAKDAVVFRGHAGGAKLATQSRASISPSANSLAAR